MFDLKDKVAIVTSALGLIGKEHCRALADAGANVVVTDLDGKGCEAFAKDIPRAIGVGADITKQASVAALRDVALQRFSKIDVLINNAAINDKFESPAAAAELSKFENYPLDLWQRSLDVNVTGMFLCCQTIGAVMAERRSGSIVNVAST